MNYRILYTILSVLFITLHILDMPLLFTILYIFYTFLIILSIFDTFPHNVRLFTRVNYSSNTSLAILHIFDTYFNQFVMFTYFLCLLQIYILNVYICCNNIYVQIIEQEMSIIISRFFCRPVIIYIDNQMHLIRCDTQFTYIGNDIV